ncbi:carboxy terminal-processing peptidase [Noviherbaspirillum sp. 1P10PC]|uniref:carboxy terminal-processing peptidase n=1 Tax=Noviherbaspirillum sp. 1P10PC TaxID=3132292 RepID=UPI0039A24B00
MKKQLLITLLAGLTVAAQAAPLAPAQQQAQAANLSAQILTRHHYRAVPLDDAMSQKIFDRYLKMLDPEHLFFLQTDLAQFSSLRSRLDDAIFQEDLRVPFDIFNLYQQRVTERLGYARELLKQDFDFSQNETYQYQRDKEPWPANQDDMRDLWRKRVKSDWLRLKLAGKDDKFIRATLDKRYASNIARVEKYKADDVFQVFMDSYATSIEPHTDYMSPTASADFDIAMSLSLVGIGAVLQEREEYTTIRDLVPGGPAALSSKLKVGDRIVAVGQGADGAMTDIVGWRVNDVVGLIRGAKDTTVRLDVLPADAGPDAKTRRIALVRNKISLERQAAKKSVIQVKEGAATRQVGVITLPMFYQDIESRRRGDKEFKSAARDVARLLDELKKDKIDSVLIDLRNNGGGSLDEAIELTSLFTGVGPVLQERNSRGDIKVDSAKAPRAVWNGTMGVLINRGSASASEIFAAAIQDYGRGVVIGEPSFGKGTVQTVINLDQMARNEKPQFGELKMTIAQFFRINGGTTQLRGVVPDIKFPTVSDTEQFGESSYDNALPWTQIKPAGFTPLGDLSRLLPVLESRHASRIAKDKDFQYLLEDLREVQEQRGKRQLSLNEAERRRERELREARLKQREEGKDTDAASRGGKAGRQAAARKIVPQDAGLQAGERSLSEELADEKAQKEARDVWLDEAARIVGDTATLLKAEPKLAARGTPSGNSSGIAETGKR